MKILLTGFTNKQALMSETLKFSFAQNHRTMQDVLHELGHETEIRAVIPGEDLGTYDKVVVFLFIPGHAASIFQDGALWAMGSRPDCLWALDDWNVAPISVEARKLARKSKSLPKESQKALVELGGDGSWRHKCFFPLFKKVSPSSIKFLAVKETFGVDFTEIWLERYSKLAAQVQQGHRERRWVHTALARESEWLEACKFSWPVLSFGDKTVPGNRRHEADLIPDIKGSWGLLSAPHPNHGWWRVRFALGAACETPVYGELNEIYKIYGSEAAWRGPKRFEKSSDAELCQLAKDQARLLKNSMMSHDEILSQLSKFIE